MSKVSKPKKQYPKRRNFSVKEQLTGKLGYSGFEELRDALMARTERPKRKRRRRHKRAAISA
jgi:hypothetical protein